MVATSTAVKFTFGLLVISLPTTLALGCYSAGITWSFMNTLFGQHGYYPIADELCFALYGWYRPGQEKDFCHGYTYAGKDYSIVYNAKNLDTKNQIFLKREQCIEAAITEMNGCEHGSEQNHFDFWFRFDPNTGDC